MILERYESNGRFCQAVRYGELIFVSGLVDIEKDSFAEQTRGVFAKIDALLERYGSSRDKIVSANVYLKNAQDAGEFNKLWLEWVVLGSEPVRTCVAVEMVHPAIQVEIAVVAAVCS